jgi:hypothetical protein
MNHMTPATPTGVSTVEISTNSKIGKVSATYAAQQSCPKSCAFRNSGCYAESGMTGFQTRRLNQAERNPEQIARAEARGIRELTGRFPLRLHVVGDCRTNFTARVVSAAADEHRAKFGNPVWTYTHAWRDVDRKSWGNVSVLASCETTEQAREAMRKGYAAAVVVAKHPQAGVWREGDLRMVPCPEQTGKADSCESCRLCWQGGKLRAGKVVIAFAAHGGKRKIQEKLVQIQLEGKGEGEKL